MRKFLKKIYWKKIYNNKINVEYLTTGEKIRLHNTFHLFCWKEKKLFWNFSKTNEEFWVSLLYRIIFCTPFSCFSQPLFPTKQLFQIHFSLILFSDCLFPFLCVCLCLVLTHHKMSLSHIIDVHKMINVSLKSLTHQHT